MSLISRITTWTVGQLLKSADLNGEFNNIVNVLNNLDANTTRWTNVDAAKFFQGGVTVLPILNIVTATNQTQSTSTSVTYADSGLTASITPSTTTSKIAVVISQSVGANAAQTTLRLIRASTTLISDFQAIDGAAATLVATTCSMIYLDSPASTSSLTYKTQFSRFSGAGTSYVQPTDNALSGLSTMWLLELGY